MQATSPHITKSGIVIVSNKTHLQIRTWFLLHTTLPWICFGASPNPLGFGVPNIAHKPLYGFGNDMILSEKQKITWCHFEMSKYRFVERQLTKILECFLHANVRISKTRNLLWGLFSTSHRDPKSTIYSKRANGHSKVYKKQKIIVIRPFWPKIEPNDWLSFFLLVTVKDY